jgi:hypothetical protein
MELLIALHVDITKAAKWHELGDTLAMDWLQSNGRKIAATHRRITEGVCGQVLSAEGHFISP